MSNIFTITLLSAFVFAGATTLLLVQTVTAKPVQARKQVNQPIQYHLIQEYEYTLQIIAY
ncbi:MAG: hypothetical protein KME50_15205 [Nostoc desertorum CM1-VF14]|jgi:hypothetical protein|nr:hypothetical protein [Nostoc desertorum CM1-VF14]